jgi:hypothetical protein
MSELNAAIKKSMVINLAVRAAKSRETGNAKQLTGPAWVDAAEYWAKRVLWALVIATSVWDIAVTFGGAGAG